MPLYYFDFRDNDHVVHDDTGAVFFSLQEVKTEAARALAELARDVLPGSVVRTLSVEVRTDFGPVLRVSLRFEAEQLMEAEHPSEPLSREDQTGQIIQQLTDEQRAVAEKIRRKLN